MQHCAASRRQRLLTPDAHVDPINLKPKPWSVGMDALGARSVASLKKALPTLEATVAASEAAALDFFQFAFRYCLVVRGPMAPMAPSMNLQWRQAASLPEQHRASRLLFTIVCMQLTS